MKKEASIKDLRRIPGVGKSIAEDFYNVGIRAVSDLKHKDPEDIYRTLERREGAHIDRCVLYVVRGAVYFASHRTHDPERLKWWNWKDVGKKLHVCAGVI
jgi:predicted RecB family nuclease